MTTLYDNASGGLAAVVDKGDGRDHFVWSCFAFSAVLVHQGGLLTALDGGTRAQLTCGSDVSIFTSLPLQGWLRGGRGALDATMELP